MLTVENVVKLPTNIPGNLSSIGDENPPPSFTKPSWSMHEASCALLGVDTESFDHSRSQSTNYLRLRAEARIRPVEGLDFAQANQLIKTHRQFLTEYRKTHSLLIKAIRSNSALHYKPVRFPNLLQKKETNEQHLLPITVLAWAINAKLTIHDELINLCQGISILSDTQYAEAFSQNHWTWFQAIYYVCGLVPTNDCSEDDARRHFPILSDYFFGYALNRGSLLSELTLRPAAWVQFWKDLNRKKAIGSNDNQRPHTKRWHEKAVLMASECLCEAFKNTGGRILKKNELAIRISKKLIANDIKKTDGTAYSPVTIRKEIFRADIFDFDKAVQMLKKHGIPQTK